ncbi:hypothetical protein [Campylobacter molothri]|uniref:Uncharacterized protein n=1 Tax=Campylobacter molothri TaxID=1032242 RepID=A0ACC5W114_9BACT|nr:hypothetical protein [Campylobacter sp. RM9760]MBZ7974574.1 hypothetical protein [Campylobacter sp. RM9754]
MIRKNKIFRQIHIYLSLFFLPCALIFAISGITYILGFNQNIGLKVQTYKLNQYIQKGKEREALIEYLIENKLKLPSNIEPIKSKNKGITIGTVHYSANIAPINENEYLITLNTRSLLGDMIMLHKDKGLWYFSILSIGFGVTLFLLYISGLIITFFANKKDRKRQLFVLSLGFLITFILAYMSL